MDPAVWPARAAAALLDNSPREQHLRLAGDLHDVEQDAKVCGVDQHNTPLMQQLVGDFSRKIHLGAGQVLAGTQAHGLQ